MYQEDNQILKNRDELFYLFEKFFDGLFNIITHPLKLLIAIPVVIIEILIIRYLLYGDFHDMDFLAGTFVMRMYGLLAIVVSCVADFFAVIYCKRPIQAGSIERKIAASGIKNSYGETPHLKSIECDPVFGLNNYIFESDTIPLHDWENKKDELETVLNSTIVGMKNINGRREIQVSCVKLGNEISDYIEWSDKYISNDDFILKLGVKESGLPAEINLNKIPMVLIGGATGSGKTELLKLLLYQAIEKQAKVIIADFKGGVDFPYNWNNKAYFCYVEEELYIKLLEVIDILEERKKILKEYNCANISELNKIYEMDISRIIFACDEIAEVLDSRGLSKEKKEMKEKIEGALSTIARQGRAFGIHLIIATQRPDANILPGQIKNNCQCRICGSCDQILSQIVMDSSEAADLVPKNIPGRFMINDFDRSIFQAFSMEKMK